jgi:hypothetical protein
MTSEQVQKVVKSCIEIGYLPNGSRKCLLCGASPADEPMIVGVWLPAGKELQRRLGCSEERLANHGGRVILYQLCLTCFERPNKEEEVEAKILKRRGVQ